MTTRHQYHDKLEAIKDEVFRMGMMAKAAIEKASKALTQADIQAAETLIKEDEKINKQENAIEEKCVVILATEQPVAGDLRFLISTLKTIRDLERIGDYAAHLAKATRSTTGNSVHIPVDIPQMAKLCLQMLEATLTAYLNQDIDTAIKVKQSDEAVDKKYLTLVSDLSLAMKQDPDHIRNLTPLLLVAKFLERLADHITSICDEIIYICIGKRTEEEHS